MMLEYKNASLVKATESVIAHGCNLKGKMGAGVAKSLADKWPKVYQSYQFACASGALHLGAVNWVQVGEERYVANVMTQAAYGRDPKIRYTSYDAVDRGLRLVCEEALQRGYVERGDSIAISKIGANLGNANWSITEAIIEQISTDYGVNFVVYQPESKPSETLFSQAAVPQSD